MNKNLKFAKTKIKLIKGNKAQINLPDTLLDKVTFISKNKKIATISKKGVITTKKKGKVKIILKKGKKKAIFTVVVK